MKRPSWYVHDPPPPEDLLEAIVGPSGRSLPAVFGSLQALARASPEEIAEHLTPTKVHRLLAALKLRHALVHEELHTQEKIQSARDVFNLYRDRFQGEKQEHFIALLLDSKHRVIKEVTVSVGTLTASIVHPREVFAPAIKERAAAILVLHNHPSGESSPSQEDLEITRRLKQTGELIGIPLLDHVVIGADSYVSLQERGIL